MDLYMSDLFYELQAHHVKNKDALKQHADQVAREVKEVAGWDTDVQIRVEPEVADKRLFAVSIQVSGMHEPVIVKKVGKQVSSTLKKVKRTIIGRLHKMTGKEARRRRRKDV